MAAPSPPRPRRQFRLTPAEIFVTVPRPKLLLTLLASSTAVAGVAYADPSSTQTYTEVGSWGQAWGDNDPMPMGPPPARQSEVPPPTTQAPADTSNRHKSSYSEVGSWGQAWDASETVVTPRTETVPSPVVSVPAESMPIATPAPIPASAPIAATPETPPESVSAPAATIAAEPPMPSVSTVRRPPRILPKPVIKADEREAGANPPVNLEADQIIYDREYDIVTARGRVELIQNNRTITADTLTYNLKQDLMGASGHVVLTEPTGEVTNADYFELTGDMKNGVARDIRVLLSDDSQMSAQTARRSGGDRTDLHDAIYTACEPCRKHPERTPLWQAKADRITHNQAEAQIEYRDAWIELAGIPVAYTPYLSHPDPTVRRKSGFLTPSPSTNSTLGPSLSLPYFFVMSENEDLTLTPRFLLEKAKGSDINDIASSAMQQLQLSAEHRWRGVSGESRTRASITADRNTGDPRGHIDAKGLFDLDETWRAGWQVQYQSDQNYRNLYKVRMDNDRPWLLTSPYVEGFGRRSYALAETMSFQGPQVINDGNKATVVLPHISHSLVSQPGWNGSYWTVDSDMLVYTRTHGTEAQRLSQRTAWSLPVITPDGQVFTLTTGLRGDAYNADNLSSGGSDTTGRALPDASIQWRYPFSRTGKTISQVIEPVGMLAISPVGGNSNRIPNEDSIDFELDETNVLRPNRLVGLDRVEGGLRGGYGLRWTAYPQIGGKVGLQVAQGWRQHTDDTFRAGSGFTDSFSDYLGRVEIVPVGMISLTDRIRLDKDTLKINRNEATLGVGPRALQGWVTYGFLSPSSTENGIVYTRRQYVNYGVSSQASQYWTSNFNVKEDLEKDGGILSVGSKIGYNDECFALIFSFNRYFSTQQDVYSGYDAMMTVVLKTLGEASTSLF
ncbi:Organic solvent tolerance protein OstA [Magnetospirillum molischianum DSM 120]|uniref:LPS-assembly protein LptD n=1 Tax=Magnetospirillum molischianum DSM 120 TaxID=1150626 RepID=H8FPI4_MAGML|nr:Organic solvent tolerance protein OstA [Magnetospirillum molischianum DSM 120]